VYVGGYTGEGLHQALDQRKAVAEAAIRHTPRDKSVIVQVGASAHGEAIDLARHAARIGARAIASVPPPGLDSTADERHYFESLAAETGLPTLLYYIPVVCGTRTLAQLVEICEATGVVGLKYSNTDVFAIAELARRGHSVFVGCDEVLAPGLFVGAAGGVGGFYALTIDVVVGIAHAAASGDWVMARTMQRELNELVTAVMRFPLLPSLKTLARWAGIDCGDVLPPRRPLTWEQEAALRAAVLETSLGRQIVGRSRPTPPGTPTVP
jgi:dihydrodipicolinate synthase/N-acetylneuraminate lyase